MPRKINNTKFKDTEYPFPYLTSPRITIYIHFKYQVPKRIPKSQTTDFDTSLDFEHFVNWCPAPGIQKTFTHMHKYSPSINSLPLLRKIRRSN